MAVSSKSSKISPARSVAFEILLEVEKGRAHSDDLLRSPKLERLSSVDKGLVTALVLGVLRWQIALDAAIRPLLARPKAKLDAPVLIALRIGALQLLEMDRIPAHAAISESVELIKRSGHRFASGMANAVLRKLAAAPRVLDAEAAYPEWMVERWRLIYGAENAKAICKHGQQQATLHLRLVQQNAEDYLERANIRTEHGLLLASTRVLLSGDAANIPAAQARIQDEGSQLVAEIAGHGSYVLDACAAPGGKALVLAERNPNARIVAYEWSKPRYDALVKRLAVSAPHIIVHHGDAEALEERDVYDLALVDVPCSGTGTLGRNPEIRHRLAPEDLSVQQARQCAILRSALRAVKPGGRVVYSTCSLEPEENEKVVKRVLAEFTDCLVLPLDKRVAAMEHENIFAPGAAEKLNSALQPEGWLQLMPTLFGTDGFFVCVIMRTA